MVEMIAADGEGVAVAAKNEDVQVRSRQRNAAGKRQSATVNVMRAVGLHKVWEAARTADAGDGGDFLMPQLAPFNQLEIKSEHREIAASRTPRWMISGDFFFGQ